MQFTLRALLASVLVAGMAGAIVALSADGLTATDYGGLAVTCVIVGFVVMFALAVATRKAKRVGWIILLLGALLIEYGAYSAGHNLAMNAFENAAARACKAYVEAQEKYVLKDYDGDRILEYAQSLRELKKQGLLDPAIADAEWSSEAKPYHGYVFRVLTAQGTCATGGSRSYISNGKLTLGYALLAWPAHYDRTGCFVFITNQNGTIFQGDYGQTTNLWGPCIAKFDPEPPWFG
ncbi:MAG TPA: DUF2950 family protein [Planctomycetota bacterium]|jgi:hypothetical protein